MKQTKHDYLRIVIFIEFIIRWIATLKVASIIITMPIVLLAMIHAGTVPQLEAELAMRWYASYVCISVSAWVIYAIQTKIVKPLYEKAQRRKKTNILLNRRNAK